MISHRLGTFAAVIAFLAMSASAAFADFKSMLSRTPGDSNVLVIVNVEKVMSTAMAMRETWNDRGRWSADSPVLTPPGTQRLVMAGKMDLSSLNSIWEVSILETDRPIPVKTIAAAQNGFVEQLGDKPAVWTPENAYFVQLEPSVLGVVAPADRQFASRWARQQTDTPQSAYLTNAAALVDSGSQIVMAMDLEDAASEVGFARRVQAGEFESLAGKDLDIKALARIVASVKGLTLRIDIADEAKGTLDIDFGTDPSSINGFIKPLAMEILSRGGMTIPDFADWDLTTQGTKVIGSGKLSATGLRHLLSVLSPPPPNTSSADANEKKQADDPTTVVAASQNYFQAVSKILDNMPAQAALSENAAWLARDSRRIDQLPALNVDPALLAWGGSVSTGYNDAEQALANGQIRAKARVAGIANPNTTYNNDPVGNQQRRTDLQNAQNQRRQVSQEERAKACEDAFKILASVKSTRSQIRAEMVAKYKVEF